MKKMPLFVALLMLLLYSTPSFAGDRVTGFWIDASVVSQLAGNGATTLKVYAGIDGNGNLCYLMMGGDGRYNIVGSEVHMQNQKGVCPPQCDFTSVDLSERNTGSVSSNDAANYINNYMRANPGVANCAKFTMSALEPLTRSSAYIKVVIGSRAVASGFDQEGSQITGADASGSAATTGL